MRALFLLPLLVCFNTTVGVAATNCLSEKYVKHVAIDFVKNKHESAARSRISAEITKRSSNGWIVIVSPLPKTPDVMFMLRIRCGEPVIEEIPTP
jgi:hypothetical protein